MSFEMARAQLLLIQGSIRKVERSVHISATRSPHILDAAPFAIEMASSCNCIAGAVGSLRPTAASRVNLNILRSATRRTFASSHNEYAAIPTRTMLNSGTQYLVRWSNKSFQNRSLAGSFRGAYEGTRSFSNSASRNKLKTIQQVRARNKGGVSGSSSSYWLNPSD